MFQLECNFLLREAEILVDLLDSCVARRGEMQRPLAAHARMLRERVCQLRRKLQGIIQRDAAVSQAYTLRVGHVLDENEFYQPADYQAAVPILQEMRSKKSDG